MKHAEQFYLGLIVVLLVAGFLIGYFFGQVQ